MVDYILELAKISERKVTGDELMADPDEDEDVAAAGSEAGAKDKDKDKAKDEG